MKLDQWVARKVTAGAANKKAVIADLSKASGISTQTLDATVMGKRLGRYDVAKAVSAATGWEVTIPELCEEDAINTLSCIYEAVDRQDMRI
jgi:hypothetical protein